MSKRQALRLPFAYIYAMPKQNRAIKVAVSGPLKRSFSYSLPESLPTPALGQRLLVPFGQSRKIGFYLGPSTPVPGLALKEITRELDPDTFFPPDLFSFCLWMSEYYFANPADCLVAALPPHLKSAQPARYRWSEHRHELPLKGAASPAKPGSLISNQTPSKNPRRLAKTPSKI